MHFCTFLYYSSMGIVNIPSYAISLSVLLLLYVTLVK